MNLLQRAGARIRTVYRSAVDVVDAGMSTAEYAVGTVAAVAFAVVLYKIIKSDSVSAALKSLIDSALNAI